MITAEGTFPAELFPFPAGYIGPVQLWVAIVPEEVVLLGEVVAYDATGIERGRVPIGNGTPVASGTGWTVSVDDGPGLCLSVEGPAGVEGSCDYPWPSQVGVANMFPLAGERMLAYGFLDPRATTVRVGFQDGTTVEEDVSLPPDGFAYDGIVFAIELEGSPQGARLTVLDADGQELGFADLPEYAGALIEIRATRS